MKPALALLSLLVAIPLLGGCGAASEESDEDDVASVSEDALKSNCVATVDESLSLPHKRDLVVRGQSCLEVSADGRHVRTRINVSWHPVVDSDGVELGTKFDSFKVRAYIARDDWKFGGGKVTVCDLTHALNGDWKGATTCKGTWYLRTATHEWESWGVLDVGIHGDGWDGIASYSIGQTAPL